MALTPEGIAEMCKVAVEEAEREVRDSDDSTSMALHVIRLSQDDTQAVAEYVSNCVREHMFNHAISEGGGMSPEEFLNHVLGVAIPTLMMVARLIYTNPQPEDKYMATVSAELRLQNLIAEKTDLSSVWPAEFVSEITQVFDEPNMAFLAGVIAGSKNG